MAAEPQRIAAAPAGTKTRIELTLSKRKVISGALMTQLCKDAEALQGHADDAAGNPQPHVHQRGRRVVGWVGRGDGRVFSTPLGGRASCTSATRRRRTRARRDDDRV